MVSGLAMELLGTTVIEYGGAAIDVRAPWRRLDLRTAILEHTGIDIDVYVNAASLAERMRDIDVVVTQEDSWGRLVDKLLGDKVEPHLVQPTFLVDYPVEMTPLAKRHPSKDGYVERFEGYVAGMEVCNAFTELNDPIEQRERFEMQEALRLDFTKEDFDRLDEEFLTAIEYGMPPTGGLGVGIDRLAMLFSGQSTVREVVLFPHLSLSQDEVFREVDRALHEAVNLNPALKGDALVRGIRAALSEEVAARITDGEIRSRIEGASGGGVAD